MVVFGQKRFYTGRSGSIWANFVVFGQGSCIRVKVVVFDQSGCYLGKSCCIRAKLVVIGQT